MLYKLQEKIIFHIYLFKNILIFDFRETSVQSAVVTAYKRLYIESATNGNKTNPVQLVRNLTALVSGANIGDLTGLEELIGMLVKSKDLDKNCFQVSIYSNKLICISTLLHL